MSDSMKLQGEVSLDTSDAERGLARVEQAGSRMAQAMVQSGQQAGAAVGAPITESIKRATAATEEAQRASMSWTEFVKASMGPAMKQAAAEGLSHAEAHTKAIRQIAAAWKEYKAGLGSAPKLPVPDPAPINNLTAAQERFLASLQRQATITTQGKAAYLELRASQLGVGEAAQASIAKIRAAETAQVALGSSAKATAWQLRQVAPQVTDIFTQIAAGQAPMQILIQQGGQLKDVFGGVGPAARALGGYLLGLLTPVNLSIAAIAGVGYAALQGSKELREFQNQATLTGNAVGLSASGFTLLRDNLAGIAGTKGKAAEALTEIAASGKIAKDAVQGVAEAAILLEKAGGQSIKKTVEQFAELAKSPADASAKLNEQYHFLTAAVYQQIKALEDQGRAQEAANLAEQTYADAMKTRAQLVVDNAGTIERAWRSVAGAAKSGWDAMLGIGRQQSIAEQLASVQAKIARAQGPFNAGIGGNAELRAQLPALREQEAFLQEQLRLEKRVTEQKAEQNRLEQLGISFQREGEQFKTKAQKRDDEIEKERVRGQELVNAGLRTQAEVEARIAAIRQRYADKGGVDALAGIKAQAKQAEETIAMLQKRMATGDINSATQLTEAEKNVAEITEKMKLSVNASERANLSHALAVAKNNVALEQQLQATKRQSDAWEKSAQTTDKQIKAQDDLAASFRQQAAEQQAVAQNFGKSDIAIKQLLLSQTKLQLAEAESSDRFDPRYIASLQNKKVALEELIPALQAVANKQAQLANIRISEANANEAQLIELELSLLGQTAEVRDRLITQRRIELDYDRQIAEMRRQGVSDEQIAAREQEKQIAISNAAARKVVEQWQRASDEISDALTGAFVDAFERGGDLGKNLADALKREFANLVLRPTIQAIFNSTGIPALLGQMGGMSGGGASGLSGLLSAGSSAASLFNSGWSLSNVGTMGAGFGGWLGFGGGAAATGTSSGFALAASDASFSAAMGGGGGISAGLASIPVAGWIALGAMADYKAGRSLGLSPFNTIGIEASLPGALLTTSLLTKAGIIQAPGGPKTESGFGYGVPARGDPSGAQQIAAALQADYAARAAAIGVNPNLENVGVFYSQDTKGTAKTQLEITGGSYSRRALHGGEFENVGRSQADLEAEIKLSTAQAEVRNLQDVTSGAVGEFLRTINITTASIDDLTKALDMATEVGALDKALRGLPFDNITRQSVEAQEKLIGFAGGLQNFTSQLQSYVQNFYSGDEQRAFVVKSITQTLQAAGVSATESQIASMTRAQYRAFVESIDVSTEAGQKLYVTALQVAGAFASITDAAENSASGVKSSIDAITSAQSVVKDQLSTVKDIFDILGSAIQSLYEQVASTAGLSALQGRDFITQALSTAQKTGYLPDAKDLQSAISAATNGLKPENYTSQFAFDRDRLVLAGQLSSLKDVAGEQVTYAQQMLDAANSEIAWLQQIAGGVQVQTDAVTTLAGALAGLTSAMDQAKQQATAPAPAPVTPILAPPVPVQTPVQQAQDSFPDDPISRLFRTLLGREPDPAGYANWTARLAGGMSIGQITRAFMFSPEYLALHSHRDGLERVPYDGYQALLHKDEAVLTAGQAGQWRSDGSAPSNKELLAEIRALRETVRAIGVAQVSAQKEAQRTFDGWDRQGIQTRTLA